ncbi:MAG: cadmium-translocating P-type ATPase [Phycisphaera sp.]|nr:cadmium-translocating P-type ATPase [Phycisphaera sp.]
MAHEHVKEMVEDQTGRASTQMIMTFVGGVLLINAALAYLIFPSTTDPSGETTNFYAETMGFVAAVLLGVPLVVRAFKDLISGHTHMDELAALAVIAAFSMGEYIEAGAIAFFMIITTLIEHRTALGARKSIESLVRLTPTKAHRKAADGAESEVEAKDLKPGDIVVVRPGDNIPADGEILTGTSTVNQANITGESLPVDVTPGDTVFGGTINVTGVMEIKVTKAGSDTTLGRVKDLILQAEQTKIPALRLLDQYATWYTPTILMIAGIWFFFNQDHQGTYDAIAILVAACPCAIILSGPTAIVAALSAAARLGVLVKNVADLEVARKLTGIVFDKTGTVTTGQLSVTKLTPVEGIDGGALLKTAAFAEQNSRHPVARAVVDVAKKAKLKLDTPTEFEEVSGRGVRAVVDGTEVLVGRETWVKERGADLTGVDISGSEGLSLLYVVRNGKAMGWVGLEDKTRPDAAKAMDALREQGIKKLVMVTGDRWSVAKRVAAEMHCTDVQAEVLPGEKLDLVDDLKAKGHTVAVVGDGVNDAPALAAGDISIAMGAAGSDVAIHSASIALMNNNLNRIPFLIRLSRRTFAVISQNMGFSLIYVVFMLSLIMSRALSDAAGSSSIILVAIIGHFLSSFVVVFNSARLVRAGEDLEDANVQLESDRRAAPKVAAVPVQ